MILKSTARENEVRITGQSRDTIFFRIHGYQGVAFLMPFGLGAVF